MFDQDQAEIQKSIKPGHLPVWLQICAAVAGLLSILLGIGFEPVIQGMEVLFGFISHQFFEIPQLAALRRGSQLVLLRWHLCVWLAATSILTLCSQKLGSDVRKFGAIFLLAWAIRAGVWIAGGNLPLVPGDSSHYIETANSVAMGLPSSKHYVESFFRDYPPIRAGKPVLDDWATPLYANTLGLLFRLTGAGIGPGQNLEVVFGQAKGLSFIFNMTTIVCMYLFVSRCVDKKNALPVVALLAVLPVHAIYAGFELRESLVGLTTLLAVWWAHEYVRANSGRDRLMWAVLAGVAGGLAILSRNTAMVLVLCLGLWLIGWGGRRVRAVVPIWAACVLVVIAPWAWLTFQTYGKPFYSYTEHFAHTFSWTVHHYAAGLPDVKRFYSAENLPEVIRVKVKSVLILFGYSTMILSPPVMLGFYWRMRSPISRQGRSTDILALMLFLSFAAATVAKIADVTQVAQLGRYYMPVYILMLPTAVRGLLELKPENVVFPKRLRLAAAAALAACLWADPTWAYDSVWFVKPFQLHWPALVEAGEFIQNNPEKVPAGARVMTWFPWEMRVTSGRITVLMPRNYDARRIREVIDQYGVTHVVWGSFEVPPHVDPQTFGPYLTGVKASLGLTNDNEIYRSPAKQGLFYPVSIHRLTGR